MRRVLAVLVAGLVVGGCGRACGGDDGAGAEVSPTADGPRADVLLDDATTSREASDASDASDAASATHADGVEYGNGPRRDLVYVDPAFTKAGAATMHADASFKAPVAGEVYAQPLYVENGPLGKDVLVVVTGTNMVYALDASSGAPVWSRSLGPPAARAGPPTCLSVQPLGIIGTPYVDRAGRTIYLDSAIGTGTGDNTVKTHLIHALSLDDGTERPGGWPADASTVVAISGVPFNANDQNQRGALAMLDGVVYVPYGAHTGDCGTYRGWVIGVPVSDPKALKAFVTADGASGIWSPRGISSDGKSLFVATGNGSGGPVWGQSQAILRLDKGPTFSGKTSDFFTPSDRRALDGTDHGDMGGAGALLIDVPGATPSALLLAHGKHGVAYVLDRANLGGFGTGDGSVGEGLASRMIAGGAIIGASSAYVTGAGAFAVFNELGHGLECPAAAGPYNDLVAYNISATAPPAITTAWCGLNKGVGGPIVTMTSPGKNAIVWSVGTEGTNQLHAWDGETGEVLFDGGGAAEQMPRVLRFSIPTVAKGRMFIASQHEVHAFKP